MKPTKKLLKEMMEVNECFEGELCVSRYYSKEKALEMFIKYGRDDAELDDILVRTLHKADRSAKDWMMEEDLSWLLTKEGDEGHRDTGYEVWFLQ